MKPSSRHRQSVLPIGLSIAMCTTPAFAGGEPDKKPHDKDPKPGNSHKCTRVDFDHDNNGWGNGDQDAPGHSGDHNNAENGSGNNNPGNPGGGPCKEESGNNGFGNGDQKPPGNSGDQNNAENAKDEPTGSTAPSQTSAVVARRAK